MSLQELSKKELYNLATQLGITYATSLSKKELIDIIPMPCITYCKHKVFIKDNNIVVIFDYSGETYVIKDYDNIWLGGERLDEWEAGFNSEYQLGAAILVKKGKEYYIIQRFAAKFESEEEIIAFGSPIFDGDVIPYAITATKAYDLYNLSSIPVEKRNEYFKDVQKNEVKQDEIPYEKLIIF